MTRPAGCPKRTGHNKLLFGDDLGKQGDRCTDPTCYQAKVQAHVAATVAAKPELVQISTAYGAQKDGSSVLPRNKYTAIRNDKPKSKDEAQRPEFKVCKFATEAIITEGSEVGTIHKVCANPACPIHHPKQSTSRDEKWKAEQEKQRREQAIANATGLRVLSAVGDAVPVRLMKRDLFFVLEKLTSLMDENRLAMLARQHGIRQKRDEGGIAKTFAALLRRADEGTLSRLLVEAATYIAQTIDFGDASLEAFASFARLLSKRLDGVPPDQVDVSALLLTGFDIKPQDKPDPGQTEEDSLILKPVGPGGGGQAPMPVYLRQVIARLNSIFGEATPLTDKVAFVNHIADIAREDANTVAQVENNPREVAMSGNIKGTVQSAVERVGLVGTTSSQLPCQLRGVFTLAKLAGNPRPIGF